MATRWYAVKTFYRSYSEGRPVKPDRYFDPDATLLEERTLLIKATNKGEAVKKAEREAKDFALKVGYTNIYEQKVTMRYIGMFDIFEIADMSLADKTEVFISTRIMSKKVSDRKISHVYIEKKEKDLMHSKRKKFINKEYSLDD